MTYHFYEFFAGGGMASIGLGPSWHCLFANDIDQDKAKSYRANNTPEPFLLADVHDLSSSALPGYADLAWASFPCQDLSIAGNGRGLRAGRSGAFWAFWRLMEDLDHDQRSPNIIAIENVPGLITSNSGSDFRTIINAIASLGYIAVPIIADAAHFIPQSRPRLFIICIKKTLPISRLPFSSRAGSPWTPKNLEGAVERLPQRSQKNIAFLSVPPPVVGKIALEDIFENDPDLSWHSAAVTDRLLSMMDDRNRLKVDAAMRTGRDIVGTIFKRTRTDGHGNRFQRAEVRFDGLAGCLRTSSGGSSRQLLLFVDGHRIRSRLMTPREAARLMGLPDEYQLPKSSTKAYHLVGDGVCVPVVRFLAEKIFEPALSSVDQCVA